MAYTVLARKYRSQTFDDVVGQDPIGQTLRNAIKTDRVGHAYLFSGTRGIGKTTMARVLAKSLNCSASEAATITPCCKCDSCVAVNLGEDIDVIEIDGATNNGVDQVRELRQNAIYRPARSRFKIYIIDEVHMLSVAAFNALLKILEEPPSHVKFIFATTEPNKVIPTIQSRCQRFDFSNIRPQLIAEQLKSILKQEKIKYQDDLILPLAKMANGSMRDGLSLLDRLISTGAEPLTIELLEEFLGCPNSERVWNLIGKLGDSDAAGTLAAVQGLIDTGLGEAQIVDCLVDYMRDLMVAKSAGVETELLVLTAEQRSKVAELADKFDVAGLVYSITTLEKLRWGIKNSDKGRALLDACVLRFALSEHFMNVDHLLDQVSPGAPKTIKKNAIVSPDVQGGNFSSTRKLQTAVKSDLPKPNDLESIKEKWQSILQTIQSKLGNGTMGLLISAVPAGFEAGVLRLAFAPGAKMSKKLCESNGRLEAIGSVISEYLGRPVTVKLEIASGKQDGTEAIPGKPLSSGQRRNEIANDPTVQMVLMELGATITGIEEG